MSNPTPENCQALTFFVGLHHPNHAQYFDRCFLSINSLEARKSDIQVKDWILDSGAFSRILTGKGHMLIDDYAAQITRWAKCGNLLAAVCQDWMCEPFILEQTGLCVGDHQAFTLENYLELRSMVDTYVMPVLQGYEPTEYVEHIHAYKDALQENAWVGVGSVCKRNTNIGAIQAVLMAIKNVRPDLRLHGFGLKQTALKNAYIRDLLYSADSMAWSYAARMAGRNANDVEEAMKFCAVIEKPIAQQKLWHP